jgi:vacuolar-type H+-ATPase subunit E/Vma4
MLCSGQLASKFNFQITEIPAGEEIDWVTKMRSVEENIEALSRAMLGDAKTEAEQILAEAKAKADAILHKAQEEAAAERAQILERAGQEADRLRGQVIATTQMKARTIELEHREKLLEKVFASAHQQLVDVQKRSDYNAIAVRLVHEALTQLKPVSAKIRADKVTQGFLTNKVIEDLSKEFNAKLAFGEPLEEGLGVIVETDDGHLQYDNTLENRLSRLQNGLRPPVYRILIGETL